jgi:hypothetical protein
MSSRLSHRFAVSALLLAVLLLLAAPPAQAGSRSSLLDNLGAKVQSWLAAWLPGAGIQGESATAPSGRTNVGSHAQAAARGLGGSLRSHRERSFRPIIRPGCSVVTDPNGGCY